MSTPNKSFKVTLESSDIDEPLEVTYDQVGIVMLFNHANFGPHDFKRVMTEEEFKTEFSFDLIEEV